MAIDVRRLEAGERIPVSELAGLLDSVRMRPIGVVALPEQTWAAEGALPLLEARDRRGAPKPSVDANVENTEAVAAMARLGDNPYDASYTSSVMGALRHAQGREGKIPVERIEAESMKLDGYTVSDVTPWEAASGGKAIGCPVASCSG